MAELAWAAGALDARGTFSATYRDRKQGPLEGPLAVRITFRPQRETYGRTASEELERLFGGSVRRRGPQGGQVAMWTISGAKACLEVDRLVLPYMRAQGRRAQLHLELCRRIVEFKPASFADRTTPSEELAARGALVTAMYRATPGAT